MLWYKAWLETRSRFLISLATITIFCAVFVHHAQGMMRPDWTSDFNRLLFFNQLYAAILWIMAVVLLGMGGIVREKAIGTSSLTLSLPVSRTRLVGVRVGMGVIESVAMGVVPWTAVFIISTLAKMPILFSQVCSYVILLVGGGLVYFAMAVLVSSLVAGEYSAPALALGIALLAAMFFDTWLRRFNVWRLVTGDFSIDRNTYLVSEHLPWLGILISLSVGAVMLLASMIVVQNREF